MLLSNVLDTNGEGVGQWDGVSPPTVGTFGDLGILYIHKVCCALSLN